MAVVTEEVWPSVHPAAPSRLEETGLTEELVSGLVLKSLQINGDGHRHRSVEASRSAVRGHRADSRFPQGPAAVRNRRRRHDRRRVVSLSPHRGGPRARGGLPARRTTTPASLQSPCSSIGATWTSSRGRRIAWPPTNRFATPSRIWSWTKRSSTSWVRRSTLGTPSSSMDRPATARP